MWTPTKNTKCCATCVHWRGARKDKGFGVETESPSARGKCGAGVPCNVTEGPAASGGNSCNKYAKW